MDETPGLRERKKAATRAALHEAALQLAIDQGVDGVTVEAIADAANVSRRTFSNYFSGKEEAIFHGDTVRLRRMLELIRAQPADDQPWTALTRAALQLAEETYLGNEEWLTRRRLLRGHPSLAAHQVAAFAVVERELAAELAERLSGDDVALRARVLAAIFLTTMRVAVQDSTEHPDRPLLDVVAAALAAAAPA
ncbi:TetR family transcriptional regulator [Micromonospora musae]|uniref:TetR family transcriptional regulator n=1 Tax=Micromonospora musae TaxID=1894970 RepID=A0A3A9YFA8_9ACTN|nr:MULTISPECIES: TetR/AcrR family transcriptional regulator [Micromonospora]RKN14975.1 TetR family transcriptional regulator [Micromonospora musae]RKN35503.1 TetR family transcriptional regulator [Micromonospora musae]TYC05091.1 TetR family transcriptional regulator [Micromonospora sp. WP24]